MCWPCASMLKKLVAAPLGSPAPLNAAPTLFASWIIDGEGASPGDPVKGSLSLATNSTGSKAGAFVLLALAFAVVPAGDAGGSSNCTSLISNSSTIASDMKQAGEVNSSARPPQIN